MTDLEGKSAEKKYEIQELKESLENENKSVQNLIEQNKIKTIEIHEVDAANCGENKC
jgi:hypothetical protein